MHFIAVPRRADSLAKALGQTHWRHAMRFNRRYRRSGHLWQNRFYSSPLGPSHLLTALAYVDLNPVRAGLVGDAAERPWSSARGHLDGNDQLRLLDAWAWSECGLQASWAATLRTGSSDEQTAALRAGDEDFVAELERISGRPLRSRKHGPTPRAAEPPPQPLDRQFADCPGQLRSAHGQASGCGTPTATTRAWRDTVYLGAIVAHPAPLRLRPPFLQLY